MNVDVDVAWLAAQTPPILIFPSPNTTHLPYDKQVEVLEMDYDKYYEYRGDLKYNENMKRSIKKKEPGKNSDAGCLYRVCRDKNRFVENRIKDDVLILGKILESMIERTSEMEKHLENVLLQAGEKELPNWDELYEEVAHSTTPEPKPNDEAIVVPKRKSVTARKPRGKKVAEMNQNLIATPNQSNNQSPTVLTPEQAQILIAQMMSPRMMSAQMMSAQSNAEHPNAANSPEGSTSNQ